jgi:hypothetical protein
VPTSGKMVQTDIVHHEIQIYPIKQLQHEQTYHTIWKIIKLIESILRCLNPSLGVQGTPEFPMNLDVALW